MNTLQQFAKICSVTYHEEILKELECYGFIIYNYNVYVKVSSGTYYRLEDLLTPPSSFQQSTVQKINNCPVHLVSYLEKYTDCIERRRRAAAI